MLVISGLGLFIAQTTIAGAVISTGVLVVDSGAKQVQHPAGGVVAQVHVRNGDHVLLGQPVLSLDTTQIEARLSSASLQLLQNSAKLARLIAERDDHWEPDFSEIHLDLSLPHAQRETIVRAELDQFSRRREELAGQLSQLDERISQAETQAEANQAQLPLVLEQRRLIEGQLKDIRPLADVQLLPQSRLAETELAFARVQSDEGSVRSAIATDKGKIAELKVTKIQLLRTWRSEIAREIALVQTASAPLTEQVALAKDLLQRSIVRSPQDGIVHELAPVGLGTVIQPAEKLMLIVPEHDKLVGEVRIRPGDIDQVYPGQQVTLQFSAFERATTPSVEGRLAEISADLSEDSRTGSLYFTARVEPFGIENLSAPGLRLVPGMPIEAFIRTEDRTILSFLTKPFADQANRAFR